MRMRRAFRALALACAVAAAVTACGGGDDSDEGSASESTIDESATTIAEATTTTLSPEDAVIADYNAAQEAVKAAYDPANPEHPGLLTHYGGPVLERHQSTLAEYQFEGVSDVLLSKESNPQVVSHLDTTAVVEDCMTEVLQLTDSATRESKSDPRTYAGLIRTDLELIDGTWTVIDARTIEEVC